VLAGCTSTYQRRGTEAVLPPISIDGLPGTSRQQRIQQINLEARSIENFAEATIGIIELDDEGNSNPAQVEMVLGMVREQTSEHDALIVNFAHGWHHEARVCDRDLACFRRVLQHLAVLNPTRKVIGIYLGWRGESSAWKGLNLTTIWARKRAAEHIGRTGAKEILIRLNDMYRAARRNGRDTTMVSVGHSLGGAMLYSAVKGQLTGNVSDIERRRLGSYRIVRAQEDRKKAWEEGRKALRAGFGDLVVLVNPAIEAREYGAFAADLPRDEPKEIGALIEQKYPYDANAPYTRGQLPVLLTVASDADTAVGWIFPAAQWISALPFRPYQLQPSGWRGMGHYGPHTTHTLTHPVRREERGREERDRYVCDCTKNYAGVSRQLATDENPLDLHTRDAQRFGELEFALVPGRVQTWDVNSPYLVIQASEGVIGEHSDIFNPVFVGFLTKYIRAIEIERDLASTPKQAR
jgi:hypothetical protein